ncbi:hypothetical protein Ddye_002040 [Dipteronia dyeriana]|uniref:Uncharacterized protein n=1 Tax=Dipteronia dyeriana TaxID=168575 RepID=A0AAD9XPK4_9ROSI|nr:hypothetical protein Ddye_002040 [Dipteronia dyeriana]
MTILGNIAHILVFPFPAQGHMIPLLDLSHQLATHGLTITILITPKNLPLLNPLLSKHPSIKTLVLPFPAHSSIPDGVENCKDLPSNSVVTMMHALGELYNPLLDWFHNHPSPPVAIISDMFLGWTQKLACEIGIRPIVFSPSGALALSVIFALWRDMPRLNEVRDRNQLIKFPKIPKSPKYPLCQVSPMYRSYVEGDPISEFIKDGFLGDIASWGLVINSFTELERVYLDHLAKQMDSRVWAVGPLLPSAEKTTERGGSSSVSGDDVISWLDTCQDQKVVYVCFGSQAVLSNEQMEKLALGLEKSNVQFIWSVKAPSAGHVEGNYGLIPHGFEDRVAARGLVISGWAPQVLILNHRAVGAFLTHCGWNSVLEGIAAGVAMLAWPLGADQFVNAGLLVDDLRVAKLVCEGAKTVPDSTELARVVAESVSSESRVMRERVMELREEAIKAVEKSGTSVKDLEGLIKHLGGLESGKENNLIIKE